MTEERNSDDWYRTGKGNWRSFNLQINEIEEAAHEWHELIKDVHKPWLCWNVDPEWCLVQQKLVAGSGWTPVVGGDPRARDPILIDSAIWIDFNKNLKLPIMHMLFPVEFAFMFCKRLAFWHSDLLIRNEKMKVIAKMFEAIEDGDMVVTKPKRSIKMKMLRQNDRYWELVACTTKDASLSQFENGSGWFANIHSHPNCPLDDIENRKKKVMWDHGGGIKYWAKYYKDPSKKVYHIDESYVEEGHCTRIRNKKYQPQSPTDVRRDLTKDLKFNYNLEEECRRLNIF